MFNVNTLTNKGYEFNLIIFHLCYETYNEQQNSVSYQRGRVYAWNREKFEGPFRTLLVL